MINWLSSQLLLISSVVIILLFLEAKAHKAIGPKMIYALWALLPLSLLANNIPQSILSVSEQPMYHYIVNLKEFTPHLTQTGNWLFLWSIGAFAILIWGLVNQWKFNRNAIESFPREKLQIAMPNRLKIYTHANLSGPALRVLFAQYCSSPATLSMFSHNSNKHSFCNMSLLTINGVIIYLIYWH